MAHQVRLSFARKKSLEFSFSDSFLIWRLMMETNQTSLVGIFEVCLFLAQWQEDAKPRSGRMNDIVLCRSEWWFLFCFRFFLLLIDWWKFQNAFFFFFFFFLWLLSWSVSRDMIRPEKYLVCVSETSCKRLQGQKQRRSESIFWSFVFRFFFFSFCFFSFLFLPFSLIEHCCCFKSCSTFKKFFLPMFRYFQFSLKFFGEDFKNLKKC